MNKAHENTGRPDGFTIGKAAHASGLTAKTIRYYEQIGLIPKARRHNSSGAPHTGGDRIYSETDIGRLPSSRRSCSLRQSYLANGQSVSHTICLR